MNAKSMNTNLDPFEPIWHFEAEKHAILAITQLQLVIWPNGLSVAGYDEHGGLQKILTYFFQKPWDPDFLENIFTTNAIFAGQESLTNIWLAEDRILLIPEQLYQEGYASEWIRKFHFLASTDVLFESSLAPALDAQILFPIPERLKELLQQYFEDVPIKPLSKVALLRPEEGSRTTIQLLNLPKLLLLSVQEKGKTLLHQVAAYEKVEDILYKIALILQEKSIDQEEVSVAISGIAPFYDNLIEGVGAFLELREPIDDTTKATLDFFKKLSQCE